ncbi:helix-hairpin-helix domain-containing protein [Halomonas sp. CH40]
MKSVQHHAHYIGCLLTFSIVIPSTAWSDIVVGSWNVRNLGWDNGKSFEHVAHVAQHFDLLAIQEVMNEEAIHKLERALEASSEEEWSSMASHALGESSYREHYAFMWRDSTVEYADGAVVFIDNRDAFAREPYSARFRSLESGTTFALANVHVTYGDSISDRLPEIDALADYWQWMSEVYPDTPRLLAGDFNLAPSHSGWEAMSSVGAYPLITAGASTLGMSDGEYANLYDNIWLNEDHSLNISDHGIFYFPDILNISHSEVRDTVSDHAPVYLTLGNAELTPISLEDGEVTSPSSTEPSCIDLNTASASELDTLPHIGPARAQDIIELRPWSDLNELTRISGLGDFHLDAITSSNRVCQ